MRTCIRCGGLADLASNELTCWVCLEAIKNGTEYNGADRSGQTIPPKVQSKLSSAPAALASLSHTMGVKGLEWVKTAINHSASHGLKIAIAATPIGEYCVVKGDLGFFTAWYGQTEIVGVHETLEAAKAAAQQDYEQCIRSALTPTQQPESVVHRWRHRSSINWHYGTYAEAKSWMAIGGYTRVDIEPLYALASPQAVPGWVMVPLKPTDEMAMAAAIAHYGARRVERSGGVNGISMTVDGVDYDFGQAFRRFWKGALAALNAEVSKS